MKRRILGLFLIFSVLAGAGPVRAETEAAIDADKILPGVRKLISVPPSWQMGIFDLKPSPVPGLYQGILQMKSKEGNLRSQNIYVSTDSRFYLLGNLYDASQDMDALRRDMISLENSPYKGKKDAPVTVVAYSDLQCGSCKKAHEAFETEKFLESYGGKVKLVFKNYPLEMHKWAFQASLGTLCAQKQNPAAFWKMTDRVFADQALLTPENLREKMLAYARDAKLNLPKFEQCYDGQSTLETLQKDIAEGKNLGVSSTPTFLINGRVLLGYRDLGEFREVIDLFLEKP